MEREQVHTEDIQDIIGRPPHGLVRWGITWVFLLILAIVGLSAFIYYPDLVKAPVRVHTTNSPKMIVSKLSGHLVGLMAEENAWVEAGSVIAWMESTADHVQVHALSDALIRFRDQLQQNPDVPPVFPPALMNPESLRLGEVQQAYQSFYTQFLTYKSTLDQGIFEKRKHYLQQEITNVRNQRAQLESQKLLQEEDFNLATSEMNRYRTLAEKKVISASEYEKQQSSYIAKQHPLQQTQSALIANEGNLQARLKDIADLDHQIQESRFLFLQALNGIISQMEEWEKQYVLTAPVAGTLTYAGIIEENQFVSAGQELFWVTPESDGHFAEINIPQHNLGKVKNGQKVLVKLNSYPFEEFGIIEGRISHFNYVPVRDSIFLARIDLDPRTVESRIQLRPGLLGEGEIITEDASLLTRLYRNVIHIIK